MPGGKESKNDPRPQRNSALLDNLGNNNLEPIENADRLSVRSMPSQRHYPGNAAGPRPGALPGQANESVLKAMKENASLLNVAQKKSNPPQAEEPKNPKPPQAEEQKAAKDPNIIDLEEEEIGIPNLGFGLPSKKQPLIQVPAQNIPANVPNAAVGQPGEIPAPAFPLGPYWTRDEVEPDMIAEHGKGQSKKEAGNNPDDNDRIRNDQLDIEGLNRIDEEDEKINENIPDNIENNIANENNIIPENNPSKELYPVNSNYRFPAVTKKRSRRNPLLTGTEYVIGIAGRTVSGAVTVGTSPILGIYSLWANNKLYKAGKKMQETRDHDQIPGWNGAKFEKKPDESGADILLDQRRTPTVWSRLTAGKAVDSKGKPKPPEVSVLFHQPIMGSSKSYRTKDREVGHAFLGIEYSRYSYETRRYERYGMKYGFYPAGDFGSSLYGMNVQENRNALVPGEIQDDWIEPFSVGRKYPASPRQINSIVKASETYADRGYNFYARNCTTFVKEMVADVAKLDTGGTIFEKEHVRHTILPNALRVAAGLVDSITLSKSRSVLADMSAKPDLSYHKYGQKQVTKEDVNNFDKSEGVISLPQKAYIPAVAGENVRRLEGKKSGTLLSREYIGTNLGKSVDEAKLSSENLASNVATSVNNLLRAIETNIPQGAQTNDIITVKDRLMHLGSGINSLNNDLKEAAQLQGRNFNFFPSARLVEPDRFRKAHEEISIEMEKISNLYRDFFKNDERFFIPVTNLLSIYGMCLQFCDECYRDSRKEALVKGDLGNIRQVMRTDKYVFMISDIEAVEFTPSRYEAYIQIYGNPTTAIQKYFRFNQLKRMAGVNQDELDDEEDKEYQDLTDMDELADEFEMAHDYLLEKPNYSQQDIDYIFSLKERSKTGLNVENYPMFEESKSPADIYQSLLLEKIYGGMKKTWDDKDNGGLSDEIINRIMADPNPANIQPLLTWLDNYLTDKAEQHEDIMQMILRGIFRSAQGYTADSLSTYVTSMILKNYLFRIFDGSDRSSRGTVGIRQMEAALGNLRNNRDSRISKLISRLAAGVVAEAAGANAIAGGGIGAANIQVQAANNGPGAVPQVNAPVIHAQQAVPQARGQAANRPAVPQPRVQAGNPRPAVPQPKVQAVPQVKAPAVKKQSTSKLRKELVDAGKYYESFLAREKKSNNPINVKADRKKKVLAYYVRLCEDYLSSLNPGQGGGSMPKEAYRLVVDAAHEFPTYTVYKLAVQWNLILDPRKNGNAAAQKNRPVQAPRNIINAERKNSGEIALIEPEPVQAPRNIINTERKDSGEIALIDSQAVPAPGNGNRDIENDHMEFDLIPVVPAVDTGAVRGGNKSDKNKKGLPANELILDEQIPTNIISSSSARLNEESKGLARSMCEVFVTKQGYKVYCLLKKRLKESAKKSGGKSASKWSARALINYLARAAVRNRETKAQLQHLLLAPYGTSEQRKILGRQYVQLIEMCERNLGKSMLQVVAFDIQQNLHLWP